MQHRPRGTRLSGLERNILRLRAIEMVLVLFYVEDLKELVVGSIRATDSVRAKTLGGERLPASTQGLYNTAWRILVQEGILTDQESKEIRRLIDYRNTIAHQMHYLTSDIGRWAGEFQTEGVAGFEPAALSKILLYRDKIMRGLAARYVVLASVRGVMFDAAERTYKQEIARLKRLIARQSRKAREEIHSTNLVLHKLPRALLEELLPGHPCHIRRNGSITEKGRQCCARLFDAGATPLAVAHLMRLSLRAVTAQHRAWLARQVIGRYR